MIDACKILAKIKLAEAKELKAKIVKPQGNKKKKKKKWTPDYDVNKLPRIDWANKKRYYLTCYAASDKIGLDNIRFTPQCLYAIVQKNKFDAYPTYYNFDTSLLIGNARINGIDTTAGMTRIIANVTVIVPAKFAEKMNEMHCAITVEILKAHHDKDVRVIDSAKLVSVSLISKEHVIDSQCKVVEILKDTDIDKRLESD